MTDAIEVSSPSAPLPTDTPRWMASPLQEMDQRLRALCMRDGPFESATRYVFSHPGKRLRSRMLLACATLNGPSTPSDDLISAMAAAELIHEASLLHDDPCDYSSLRRGKPTVAARFDVRTALLLGAYFLGHALSLLADVARRASLTIEFPKMQSLAEGQLLETLPTCVGIPAQQQRYRELVLRKTAPLFELACSLGTQLGRTHHRFYPQLGDYARHFALAFQVIDDIDDLESGDQSFPDLNLGLPTWPILEWASGEDDSRAALCQIRNAKKGWERMANHDRILASGAVHRSRRFAGEELTRARLSLAGISLSPGKEFLMQLAKP